MRHQMFPDMSQLKRFISRKPVYHTLLWLIYFASYFVVIIYGMYGVRDPLFYLQSIPMVLVDVAMVYANVYILIPRFLGTGKYLNYAAYLLLIMAVSAAFNIMLRIIYADAGSLIFASLPSVTAASSLATLAERGYLIGLTTAIKITRDWLVSRKQMKLKEKHFLETELSFLKSQIQPHFFFNTLNNLYSLTLQKSDKAPEVVLKLSDLMSYMLYGSNAPTVALSDEIDYLKNYIDLEKLRFGNRLTLDFKVSGDPIGYRIPPLLLILFIENSFKHGVRNSIAKAEIRACLEVTDKYINFRIENPVSPDRLSSKGGIGLKNVRRRLDLIYGQKYKLETGQEEGRYKAFLQLPVTVSKTNVLV
ncbi:MAG: sensor histidine kinase [Chitinophagaceae bacterium]|nr:MAG: sensor histidine kinase [Chitinophagaceae bacterium]